MSYFLAPSYRERLEPAYFHDEGMDAVWQPDVYPDAAALARILGSREMIDLGCGDGSKLAALHPEFEIVGIDIGANLERSRESHDIGTWLEFDLDSNDPLPVDDLAGSVLICADVLEHLRFPERTLRRVREALDRGADAFVLSTPERDLAEGFGHLGPPRNPSHVREWNTAELRKFLESCGLEGYFGLTRSNDYLDRLHTIFVVVPGPHGDRRRLVEMWFRAREPWERRGIEHAQKLADERARVDDFLRWYKQQIDSYHTELENYARMLEAASRRNIELEAALDAGTRPFSLRARDHARVVLRKARRLFQTRRARS